MLTVVGPARITRPYYLCSHCHQGQFPADAELDVGNTEFSPGVRRMQAVVGRQAPFDHGREPMKTLAGLEVTAKRVEPTAEAAGDDIAKRGHHEIQKAIQIVDLYHARQHLWELVRRLHPNDKRSQKAWMKIHQRRLLDKDEIQKLAPSPRSIEASNARAA
ncbi:MAG: hypothetical protein ABI165_02005 [Bryobacteraceae bacterium]